MNNIEKKSREHYEKYFKPTGEVRVPKYGDLYLNLDTLSYSVVREAPKEPYSGLFEPKNPYVIMEEIGEVLAPPEEDLEIVFCLKDGSVYMGSYLGGKYIDEVYESKIKGVVAWKYTSEIFEELTSVI